MGISQSKMSKMEFPFLLDFSVFTDPGHGKRTKNVWYSTQKYGEVRWLGLFFSCKHGRRSSTCKECGGSQVCEHNIQRSTCYDCDGSSICSHGRQRQYCKECGGSQICKHNLQRQNCKVCDGSNICSHGRQQQHCKVCKK